MAKRAYGAANTEHADKTEEVYISRIGKQEMPDEVEEDVEDILSKATVFIGGRSVNILICGLVGLLVVFLILAGFFFYKTVCDGGYGAFDETKAVTGFVDSFVGPDHQGVYKYMPSGVRSNSALIVDDTDLSLIQSHKSLENIEWSPAEVIAITDVDVDDIRQKAYAVYGFDIGAKAAKNVEFALDYTCKDDSAEGSKGTISADFVAVKIGFKWYVLPVVRFDDASGEVVSEPLDVISKEDDSVSLEHTEGSDEDIHIVDGAISEYSVPEVKNDVVSDNGIDEDAVPEGSDEETDVTTIEYRKEIVKPHVDLEPSKNILKDVQKGKVKIDDIEYTLPCAVADFKDFVKLSYSADGLSNTKELEPNFIMVDVPVKFVNEDYDMTEYLFSVGNMTKENVLAGDGSFTTVYLGYPKSTRSYQIYDYPTVYLPGNVTFGTTYSEVVGLYGELEKCTNFKNVVKYSDDAKVYQITLNRDNNHLYLQFVDDKLVGIEWYYFDFNDY